MINTIYKNSILYYQWMRELLEKKITPLDFDKKWHSQRGKDIDENRNSGYTDYYLNKRVLKGKEKEFKEKYSAYLYTKHWKSDWKDGLLVFEEGGQKLDIKTEQFFMGIWRFLDPYVREYYPSDSEIFDPKEDVGEEELLDKVGFCVEILDRNKERWM